MSNPIDVPDVFVPLELQEAIAQVEEARRRMIIYRYGLVVLACIMLGLVTATVLAIFSFPADESWIQMGLVAGTASWVMLAVLFDGTEWLTRRIGTMKNGVPIVRIRDDPRSRAVVDTARVIFLYRYKRSVVLARGPGWFQMINRIDKEHRSVQKIIDLTYTALRRDGPLGGP